MYTFIINCDIPLSCSGKGQFIFFLIILSEKFDVFGVKSDIFQKWTYTTDSLSSAILKFSIMNFVGTSENITFKFSSLIHVPEWVLCWVQVMVGTVSQQEEHSDQNKIS
jgi:hypothetical protein